MKLLTSCAVALLLCGGAWAQQDYGSDESPIHTYAVYHRQELPEVGAPGFAKPDGQSKVIARFADGSLLRVSNFLQDPQGHAWFAVILPKGKSCYVRADQEQLVTVIKDEVEPDPKGDYSSKSMLHQYWQVVDKDPAGLNGREAPDGKVLARFPKGTVLRAVLNPYCQLDSNALGHPFLYVNGPSGFSGSVRANARYIKPCDGPDPLLKP